MGDRLLYSFVAIIAAFMLGLAAGGGDLLVYIRGFPAPTASWATIVTGLAWPLALLFFVIRFEAPVSALLATVVERAAKDRKVKLGQVEFERDVDRQVDLPLSQVLLDTIRDTSKLLKLRQWMIDTGISPLPSPSVFCVSPLYERYHAAALAALRA